MLLRGQSALGRNLPGLTLRHHAHPQMVQVLRVPLVPHLQDLFVAACRPRLRLTMLPQVLITHHRNTPHSLFKRNHHHISSNSRHPIAFRTPTTVPMLMRAAFHLLLRRHRLAWLVHHKVRPTKALSHPMDALPARRQRFDLSWKLHVLGRRVTVTRDLISTILIRLLAAVLRVARLLPRLPWLPLKQLLVIVMTDRRPHHRSDCVSGRRMMLPTLSHLAMMRSVRSLKSHTAAVRLLRIRHRHRRFLVRAHTTHQKLVGSMMATTHLKPLIIRRRSRPLDRLYRHRAYLNLLSRNDPSIMSRLLARWKWTKTMTMKAKTPSQLHQSLIVGAHVPLQ
jgi:hypothetical protein